LKLVSLGHISLDGSKSKALSYGHIIEKEQALSPEIDELVEKANRCDQDEDKVYQDKAGYEIPEDLKFKQNQLAKIKVAKQSLEQREEQLNPGKAIDEKNKSVLPIQTLASWGKRLFRLCLQCPISVDADLKIIVAQHIS
jgi:transposase